MTRFAGITREGYEFFIERIDPRDFPAASDRWKQLRSEGWDVEALGCDDGGQVTTIIGLGCRYLEAVREAVA